MKIPKKIDIEGKMYKLKRMSISGVGDNAVYNIVYRSGASEIKMSVLEKDLEDEFDGFVSAV